MFCWSKWIASPYFVIAINKKLNLIPKLAAKIELAEGSIDNDA
jgi:hypothetical protein